MVQDITTWILLFILGCLLVACGSDSHHYYDLGNLPSVTVFTPSPSSPSISVSSEMVGDGECKGVFGDSVWIENIQDGEIFDVYYNDKCSDAKGEYCDNVGTAYGHHGSIDTGHGSSTFCPVGTDIYYGVKRDNASIEVFRLSLQKE